LKTSRRYFTDKVTILGTASAFPTKTRNHPSIYINLDGNRVLFDCGEGTQRQIRTAGLSPAVDYIFLTHWHGDHSLGVGGILQSLNMMGRTEPLIIVGPIGTNASVNHILKTYKFYSRLNIKTRSLDLKKETLIEKIGTYSVYGINVKHAVKCIGFKVKEDDALNIKRELLDKNDIKPGPFLRGLKEGRNVKYNGRTLKAKDFTYLKKGKSLVYLTDLVYEKSLAKFAKDADVLIIEATFSSALEKKAQSFSHLTIYDALTIAKLAGVKRVYLMHTSQRYENVKVLLEEIKEVKKKLKLSAEVHLPEDFSEVKF
jgi:ribonuclease Z